MAVAFDTDALDLRERMDAVVSVFQDVSAPAHVAREQRDVDPRVRMDLWDLGAVELFRGEMGGIRLRRTMTQIARAPAGVLAIALQESGTGRHEQGDVQRDLTRGDLLITHLDSPYDHLFTGNGACQVLHIGVEQLDLPFELVYRVAVDPRISPLARTMAQHITDTAAAVDRISPFAAAQLGTATIELARALFLTASSNERASRDALATILPTRIHTYIKHHLTDTDLSAETIAAAHNISVRYLYKITANAEFTLAQWITNQRLHAARAELANQASAYRSVAMIARTWGFTNPAHFSRRFRDAFGSTPREWRTLALGDKVPDSTQDV